MNTAAAPLTCGADLRNAAERRLGDLATEEMVALGPEQMRALVHELQVHHIELEIQNEELRLSQRRLLEAHETLRRSRERFFRLYHDAPVGYVTLDERGFVVQANERLAEMSGRGLEQIEARPFIELLDPVDQAQFRLRYRAIFKSPADKTLELRLLRGDGTTLEVQVEGRVPVVEPGHPWEDGLLLTLSDISALKGVERELHAARHLADQANRAKSEFLSSMSHELRTPLNGILGYAQALLHAGGLDADAHLGVARIQQSGQHLLSLINDILDLSKVEQGRMEIEQTPFHLDDLLDHLRTLIAHQASAKGLDLGMTKAPGVTTRLEGDPLRLGQVLLNLLNNAVKFSPQGEVTLRIREIARDQGRVMLHFEVQDQGIGIPMERQLRLFRQFEQGEAGIARKYGGSGLGLAISKRLVELMGGEIGVESRPGVGSRFYFTVLLKPHTGPLMRRPAEVAGAPARLHGARILLVEDNQTNRDVVHALLGCEGVELDAAEDGQQALRLLAERGPAHYHLVLMDVQMPVLDGLETTRRLRTNPAHRALPVIALTADAMSGDRERCLAAGMDDYLTKPIDRDELIATLGRWVAGGDRPPGPRPVRPEAATDTLPQIEGLDLGRALTRLRDQRLLETLLERFFDQQGDQQGDPQGNTVEAIRRALAEGDRATAELLAHTFKGLSATIGAEALPALAQQVVEGIRDGRDSAELDAPLEAAAQRLTALHAGLRPWIEARRAESPPPPSGDGGQLEAAARARLAEMAQRGAMGEIVRLLEGLCAAEATPGEAHELLRLAREFRLKEIRCRVQ